jgi:hypothetical protein
VASSLRRPTGGKPEQPRNRRAPCLFDPALHRGGLQQDWAAGYLLPDFLGVVLKDVRHQAQVVRRRNRIDRPDNRWPASEV